MQIKLHQKSQTLLGFDFGLKHIGIAVGQTITKQAKPLITLKAINGVPHWEHIAEIIKEWRPDALVVGIPLNMDGTKQPLTERAEQFINELEKRFQLSVFKIDERLTTVEAKQHLFDQGGYRALNKSAIDAVSAQIILESFIQSRHS